QISHFKAGWRVVEREKHIVGEIDGVNFKGVVDRIDQDTTHTLILDYKSGSIVEANRTKNLEKLTDFQMSIYSELLKNSYSNIELAFVELFNGKITPIAELEVKTELLRENISQLKQLNKVVCGRCEDISRCQYCDYTLLCKRGDYL
ncbi:MAG: PD-(D/E)XK nuclease family protein, partial [Sulfurovaceae bacterium]|nr:PD-(D/E)XK nuclease family protein [Sulfurovaceae bacterium]